MADWLLIRFSHDPAVGVQWLVADAAGRIVTSPESGTLSQASPAAIGRKVAVLVPSADVLRTESDIPAKAGLKARYVRSYSKGSNLSGLNSYQEIEVYGQPAKGAK